MTCAEEVVENQRAEFGAVFLNVKCRGGRMSVKTTYQRMTSIRERVFGVTKYGQR